MTLIFPCIGVQPLDGLLTLTLACVLALVGGFLAYLLR